MSNMAEKFPLIRPDIVITKSSTKPFDVDLKEMRWWFAIPEVGKKAYWTIYDQPEWKLTEVSEMNAVCEAQIHDTDCVEVTENDWSPDEGWKYGTWTIYGKITDDEVRWIATSHVVNGKKIFKTYLDEDFNENWGGDNKRHIKNNDRLKEIKEDVFEFDGNKLGTISAGFYDVKIGDKTFTCMKVLESEKIDEKEILVEVYITKEGRTVLFRRYNGEKWGGNKYQETWAKKLKDNKKIIINGVTFIHWYDCTSDVTL